MTDNSETFSITVQVEGLKPVESQLHIAIYNNADNWLKKPFMGQVVSVKNGTALVVFTNVPKGKYAISCFQDLNGSGKLDIGFMGIPKEPYAFSNRAKGLFGPPSWESAGLKVEKSIKTVIKL